MAFDFPNSPTLGQAYGNYLWDGEKWTLPNLVDPVAARKSVYVAPFDAMAYSGMQVNGSMEVSQENGAVGVPGIANNLKYIVDGWAVQSIGTGVITGQQISSTIVPGFAASLQLFVTTGNAAPAATALCRYSHKIEGYRAARLAWGTANAQPITLAFWVWAARAGNYSGSITNAASNRSYPFLFTITAPSTWQYITLTIPGDTAGTWAKDNTTGMEISITLLAGTTYTAAAGTWAAGPFYAATGAINGALTNDNFLISGVVVLPGIEAPSAARSPLIMRPYDQELITCRRYYQSGAEVYVAGYGLASNGTGTVLYFTPTMRATPTVTVASTGQIGMAGSPTSQSPTIYDTRVLWTKDSTASAFVWGALVTADARL